MTAIGDIDFAKVLRDNRKYAHACFLCQQAAEKSIKSVHYFFDSDPWGHSVYKLIVDLKMIDESMYHKFERHIDEAKMLDRLYIPTRYPNGLPDIIPDDAFFLQDANEALSMAGGILQTVKEIIGYEE
jgi:HEPN domain-containing protein